MAQKWIKAAGAMGLLFIMVCVACGSGCSRSESPQSQQGSAPTVQQAQPPAVPPPAAPAPPQAVAPPASPVPAAPPQAMAPPTAMQPATAGLHNASLVQLGMTSAQVRELLGEPGQIKQKRDKVEWEYWSAQARFEVEMVNDRVVSVERH